MPRGPWVYVGTSDDEYHDDLSRPRATSSEVDELIEMTRDCFPGTEMDSDDVRSTWAGIRPLIHESGKSTRDMSRHDEVWITQPGLVTVAGGKLTTYRPMARRVLASVARDRGRELPGSDRTAEVPLSGRPDENIASFRQRIRRELMDRSVAEATIERIQFLYGSEAQTLLEYGAEKSEWLEPLASDVPALKGEVRLAVEHAMALTLPDILDRRLALLLFSPNGGLSSAPESVSIAGNLLGWSPDRRSAELETYHELVREHGPKGIDTPATPTR